jgi:hypothetical protein
MSQTLGELEPRLLAMVDLLTRTGATRFDLGYDDGDTIEGRCIWLAAATYGDQWEVGAAQHPVMAVQRLVEQLLDGATCTHCHRPTGVVHDIEPTPVLDLLVCVHQWDPELATYRRGCEGDHP